MSQQACIYLCIYTKAFTVCLESKLNWTPKVVFPKSCHLRVFKLKQNEMLQKLEINVKCLRATRDHFKQVSSITREGSKKKLPRGMPELLEKKFNKGKIEIPEEEQATI